MKKKDVRPSLIDRLLHSERFDTQLSYFSIDELRESVQADLQALLNTRVRFLTPDESAVDVHDTIIDYGLPDMTTQSLVSEQGRREFADLIERAIRRFEPRFKNVTVTLGERSRQAGAKGRNQIGGFVFRVDAVLFADPAPEDVSFDSHIDPDNQAITLKETYR